MPLRRRQIITGAMAMSAGCWVSTMPTAAAGAQLPGEADGMYGLIGKMTATPGQRDALAAILLDGTEAMPGCLSYIIAADPADANAIWITEVWDSEVSHKASLSLPAVQAAITRGRPLIAGFSDRVVTAPLGGHGLVHARPDR